MSEQWLSFSAEVSPQTTEGLLAALAALHNQGTTILNVMLSTPGGSVMHGMTIYNTLIALPFKVITWNVGNVDSIGNVIFLAGEERYAAPLSTFMFHGVGFDLPGGFRAEEQWVRERLDGIQADHKRIGAVLQAQTALNEGDVLDLFKEARTKDAAWAEKIGIINAIREPRIAAGVPVHSLVFQR